MRIQFQASPADLYGVFAYALVVSGWLLVTGAPNPLGLVLVFLIPGYLAMACLIPRADQGDWTLRVGLSLGLSLALVAFLGIGLNFTPWGITFTSVTLSELALSLGLGLLAYRQGMATPVAERMEVTFDLHGPRREEYSLLEKGLAGLLAAILIVVVPFLAQSLTQPRPTPGFTELYLLGPSGNFSGIPSSLKVSQLAAVRVVIVNHEGTAVNYTLRVDLVGVRVVYNSTSGNNDTVEVNRTTLSSFPMNLQNGRTWNELYNFSIARVGSWQVQFVLFRGADFSASYRFVRLNIDVAS